MELGQVCEPFVPAVTVPDQVKIPAAPPPTEKVGKLPGIASVTVTVLPPTAAVAPTAALAVLHALIAAPMFVAREVVVLAVTAYVPAVLEPPQVLLPVAPPPTAPQLKRPPRLAPPTVKKGPGVVVVTVNVLPDE